MEEQDFGTARISPNTARAGQKGTWEILCTIGKTGIKQGGSLRIITPRHGLDTWQIGKVLAFCDNPGVHLEVNTEKTYPLTFHHSNYAAITVIVYGRDLKAGERIRAEMGAVGGYVSGRFIQTRAQTHAGPAPFEVFVDPLGNARFSREVALDYAYHEVPGELTVTVGPADPARIRCTLRNSPAPGKPAIGVLSVEDEYENPMSTGPFRIALFPEEGPVEAPEPIEKPPGSAGVKFTVRIPAGKTNRLGASSWQQGIYGVSNPVCPGFFGPDHTVYFGDLHVMTGSAGNKRMDGTTESALQYARDVFGLDFSAVTNTLRPELWPHDRDLFRAYNKDHEFVTIPAYENGLSTGHKNVYFSSEPETVSRARTAPELFEALAGQDCTVISHHTNTHSETDPERSWSHHHISTIDPRFERLVEICQNRGSFERDEIGGEVSFGGFGSSIRDILAHGLRLGFVGGTDTHRGRPGSPLSNQSGLDARASVTGGITAVLCPELTRQAVWEALLARRSYAATSTRILLDFKLNGLLMGTDHSLSATDASRFASRTITVKAIGTRPITRIVIVRNGREIHEEPVHTVEHELTWEDSAPLDETHDSRIKGIYYYAKVYQQDRNMAWSSPIWLSFEK